MRYTLTCFISPLDADATRKRVSIRRLSTSRKRQTRGGKRDHVEIDKDDRNTSIGTVEGHGTERGQATCVSTPVYLQIRKSY